MRENSHSPPRIVCRASAPCPRRSLRTCNRRPSLAIGQSTPPQQVVAGPKSRKLDNSQDSRQPSRQPNPRNTTPVIHTSRRSALPRSARSVCTIEKTSRRRETGTLRSNRSREHPHSSVPEQAPERPREASREMQLSRRYSQSRQPKAAGTALRPNRAVAGKSPSGTAPTRSLRADRKPAFRFADVAAAAGPVRIPHNPLLPPPPPLARHSSEQILHPFLNGRARRSRWRNN